MSQPLPSRAERFRRFSDELDDLASRSDVEAPASAGEIAAIFAEHEAECGALDAAEREAEADGSRAVRRV